MNGGNDEVEGASATVYEVPEEVWREGGYNRVRPEPLVELSKMRVSVGAGHEDDMTLVGMIGCLTMCLLSFATTVVIGWVLVRFVMRLFS
jgi:hypothetical protein